jgi:hypothetical protein
MPHVHANLSSTEVVAPLARAGDERSAPWQPTSIAREDDDGAAHAESTSTSTPADRPAAPPFETAWDFVKALTRSDAAALGIATGAPPSDLPIDSATVRKLLGTFWFRSVFPLLSDAWRERMLEAISETEIQNHWMRHRRHAVRLSDLTYEQMRDISAQTLLRGTAGHDLQLLLAIGQLWGEAAFRRLRFVETQAPDDSSRLGALLGLSGPRSPSR